MPGPWRGLPPESPRPVCARIPYNAPKYVALRSSPPPVLWLGAWRQADCPCPSPAPRERFVCLTLGPARRRLVVLWPLFDALWCLIKSSPSLWPAALARYEDLTLLRLAFHCPVCGHCTITESLSRTASGSRSSGPQVRGEHCSMPVEPLPTTRGWFWPRARLCSSPALSSRPWRMPRAWALKAWTSMAGPLLRALSVKLW